MMMQMVQAWFIYLVLVLGTRYLVGSSMVGMLVRTPLAAFAGKTMHVIASRWFAWMGRRKDIEAPLASLIPSASFIAAKHAATITLQTLSCPSCLGFWMGIAYIRWFPLEIEGALRWIVAGFLGMLLSKAWYAFTNDGGVFETELQMLDVMLHHLCGSPPGADVPAGTPDPEHPHEHDFDDLDDPNNLDHGVMIACDDCAAEFAMFSDIDPSKVSCPRCGAPRCSRMEDTDLITEPEDDDAEETRTQEAADPRHG